MLLETKNRSHRYAFLKMKLGRDFMYVVELKGIGEVFVCFGMMITKFCWLRMQSF